MTTESPNIYQRINAVMKEVEYVKKDVTVKQGGGYKAVSHDNVTSLVRSHMVEMGIVLTVTQESQDFNERDRFDESEIKSGLKPSKMRMYNGQYIVRFINIYKPDDFIEVKVFSQAMDAGDKASGKAMSYATKYAILKTFMIETGENEESRTFDEGKELISATDLTELQSLLIKADKTSEYLIEYLNNKGANIERLDQLQVSTFGYSKALLINAIAQIEKAEK